MADPLTLLRDFTRLNKPIEEKDGKYIIFGEFSWPKTVKTNFRIYASENSETGTWEYYTLETLLYFLKNTDVSHPVYVRKAAGEDVAVVRRPDRKELLAYLRGQDNNIPKSIDKSARLEMHTRTCDIKRTAEDNLDSSAAKRARVEGFNSQQDIKDRLAEKLKDKSSDKLSINRPNLKPLDKGLTIDKIKEIRAKLISNRRTRIKPEDEDAGGKAESLASAIGDLEVSRESSNIFGRERQWRTRTTILQSTGKSFSKTITAILTSVKMREEGKHGKNLHGAPGSATNPHGRPGYPGSGSASNPMSVNQRTGSLSGGSIGSGLPGNPNMLSQPRQLPGYNRYDQEAYNRNNIEQFNIETTGTFSGMTLKSVTEGSSAQRKEQNKGQNGVSNAGGGNATPGTPNSRSGTQSGQQNQQNTSSTPGKRPSRTPIIIIPAAPKSLITMFNAKEILQDCRFISVDDKKALGISRRENELLIQRRKEGGLTVPYRVIDNPAKLTNADWDRVVAVFVMGQAWQFKGWPWDGNPTQIFSKVAAFHLKWDESSLEKNIGNWAVNIIQLSRNKRHLDRARLMVFWEMLDRYMVNNKPHLRF